MTKTQTKSVLVRRKREMPCRLQTETQDRYAAFQERVDQHVDQHVDQRFAGSSTQTRPGTVRPWTRTS
jgi:hypothetical protein